MQSINIHAAKTQLSRLVDLAGSGEEIIIARAGKPVARLMPLAEAPHPEKRVLGRLAGAWTVPDWLDDPLPQDVLDDFEGA